MFSSALTVDADYNPQTGWELCFRFPDDSDRGPLDVAYSDVPDATLAEYVGPILAALLIEERQHSVIVP